MPAGRPRSTLTLIKELQGAYGLVRLEVLRKDGSSLPVDAEGRPGACFRRSRRRSRAARSWISTEGSELPLCHTNIFPPPEREKASAAAHCLAKAVDISARFSTSSHSLEDTIEQIKSSKRHLAFLFNRHGLW